MPIFDDDDRFIAEEADLILTVRDARHAFHAANALAREWDTFADQIASASRRHVPTREIADEAKSWAQGWWKRAHHRLSDPR
jgi:hypothetical protein